jgi:hypothetical protein
MQTSDEIRSLRDTIFCISTVVRGKGRHLLVGRAVVCASTHSSTYGLASCGSFCCSFQKYRWFPMTEEHHIRRAQHCSYLRDVRLARGPAPFKEGRAHIPVKQPRPLPRELAGGR